MEQIAKLKSTKRRQNLEEIFNGPTGEESVSGGEGLKILTPNQMLYQCFTNALPNQMRLPIFLAEIKHLLYSLNRSRKL